MATFSQNLTLQKAFGAFWKKKNHCQGCTETISVNFLHTKTFVHDGFFICKTWDEKNRFAWDFVKLNPPTDFIYCGFLSKYLTRESIFHLACVQRTVFLK